MTLTSYLRDDGIEMVEFKPHMAVARPFGERIGLITRVIEPEAAKPGRGRRYLAVGPASGVIAPPAPPIDKTSLFVLSNHAPHLVSADGGIGSRIKSGTTAEGSGGEPAPVRGAPAPSPAAAPPVALGPRERRSVKALRAAGNSVGEIAWALDVPRAAVEAVLADQRRGAR